jgi:hypothetical protein
MNNEAYELKPCTVYSVLTWMGYFFNGLLFGLECYLSLKYEF